uniref:uncharacterized protein LOC129519996 n=1 Tax=Nyctereutes procyonoides TaxID=34880 RepID=UPI002444718A|nr:uncharacterized protein LOC129519996 [Nyctereutes procyonoides]
MAFLVAGTLQVASLLADTRQSLERKVVGGPTWPRPLLALRGAPPQPTLALPPQGKYSLQGPRVALTLSTPEVSASTVAVLEAVFRTLGFERCQRTEASVQGFLGELAGFREQLDGLGGPVGCALVALLAPRGQLGQPQQLVRELSHCRALWGRPKVFLLLSSAPGGEWPRETGDGTARSRAGAAGATSCLRPTCWSPRRCPGARSLPHGPEPALWPLSALVPAAAADGGGGPDGTSLGRGPAGPLPWLCCALLSLFGRFPCPPHNPLRIPQTLHTAPQLRALPMLLRLFGPPSCCLGQPHTFPSRLPVMPVLGLPESTLVLWPTLFTLTQAGTVPSDCR